MYLDLLHFWLKSVFDLPVHKEKNQCLEEMLVAMSDFRKSLSLYNKPRSCA